MNDFDSIAWCYEPLKQLVFGNKLELASAYHFRSIQPGSEVLILGGGAGKIINRLPDKIRITFLEKSARMISKAKKSTEPMIAFINADFLEYQTSERFDYVICPFFLDVFNEDTLTGVIKKIDQLLKRDGFLIVTDFEGDKQLLVRMMYLFFKLTTGIQATELPPIHEMVTQSGFRLTENGSYSDGTLFSNSYQILK